MKRFTGHREKWGEFVDVKMNAAELLAEEIKKKRKGRVWVSGVCDPYQPIEEKYEITKKCIDVLAENSWPATIQTKSSLVLRDIGILKRLHNSEVGFTITTADEHLAKKFEPEASPPGKRIEALGILRSEGIRTFAMIAPILPGAEALPKELKGKADYVILDRLNYHYADRAYREYGMMKVVEADFFARQADNLKAEFKKSGIDCRVLF